MQIDFNELPKKALSVQHQPTGPIGLPAALPR
jgi:hypothetical protein